MLTDDDTFQQLTSSIATRSATFVLSSGHRRTRSEHGTGAHTTAAGGGTNNGHKRLSQRLSLDTRPTASTSQRRGIINGRKVGGDNAQGNRLAPERIRHGARSAGNEDDESSESSSDDSVRPEVQRRPQSAWNSRTGRRPRFTFSDVDKTDVDERWRTSDATRCELTVSDSDGDSDPMMTLVQPTSDRQTGRRASQIPVRTDRLHPSTINHVEDRPRRHSVYDVPSHNVTVLDLVRGTEMEEEDSTSGCRKPSSPSRSFPLNDGHQEASMRVLARLARTGKQPETEMTSSTVSRRPRKLDPILPPSVVVSDVDRLRVDTNDTATTMTSAEMELDDVTSGEIGRDENCRMRPVVSRKAKALMMM